MSGNDGKRQGRDGAGDAGGRHAGIDPPSGASPVVSSRKPVEPRSDGDVRRHAPATHRNRGPILKVLRRVLPADGVVLEVASGTGEHAVFFAPHLAPRIWWPSDPDPGNRASIRGWAAAVPGARPHLRLPPLDLDVTAPCWPGVEAAVETGAGRTPPAETPSVGEEGKAPVSAIVAINLIHIAPWEACEGLMAGAGRILAPGGVLYLYGPYRIDGRHTAPSNEEFDRWLKARDPRHGVRDLSAVEAAARRHGLRLTERIAMPANNLSLVFVAASSVSD